MNLARVLTTALAATALVLALALAPAPAALADHTQVSILQDDQHLLYDSADTAEFTMFVLKLLGVQEVRVTVEWQYLAPRPSSRRAPRRFNAANPAAYPASAWARYDRVVKLAKLFGIGVLFNLTGPGPLWATGSHPVSARAAYHWYLNPSEFGEFVHAVGVRYSGHYRGLPAVVNWSIWNEPDQPGWLAPQSTRVGRSWVAVSPRLYRSYLDTAYSALVATGHGSQEILIGELAPEGDTTSGEYEPMTPMPFLRDLYCVNGAYRPLAGAAASALGCPSRPSARAFAAANPGLFRFTGFAHHPYYFFHPPNYSAPEASFVPIADLGRLERGLDSALAAWGVHRRPPIYLTEYGYQTDPPDPYENVSPAEQAVYLNEADYMAWGDPRVRSVGQFQLYDSPPDHRFKADQFGYWDTFQTGLAYADGKVKPAFAAYRMPLWIPHPDFDPGSEVLVWGQVRPAQSLDATALVQWRAPGGSWTTLGQATAAAPSHYFTALVSPPGTGEIRIAWAVTPQSTYYSRAASVTANR
jgi:hypothetical protein